MSPGRQRPAPAWLVAAGAALLAASLARAAPKHNYTSEALVYARLRHDPGHLAIYKGLQKPWAHQELPVSGRDQEGRLRQYYANELRSRGSVTEDELILEALDQVYLSRLIHYDLQEFGRPHLNQEAQAYDPRLVDQGRCFRELLYLVERLNQLEAARARALTGGSSGAPEVAANASGAPADPLDYRVEPSGLDPELAAWLDSMGVEEAGLLLGNFNWLGSRDECVSRRIVSLLGPGQEGRPAEALDFRARYCVAALRSPGWPAKLRRKLEALQARHYFSGQPNWRQLQHSYLDYHRIQLGACLPLSCDSGALKRHPELVRRLAMHRLRAPFANYTLSSLYCLPDETSELRRLDAAGKLWVLAMACWLACVAAATGAHARGLLRGHPHRKLVLALSLVDNWRKYVASGQPRATSVAGSGDQNNNNNNNSSNNNNNNNNNNIPEHIKLLEPGPKAKAARAPRAAKMDDLRFLDTIKVWIMPGILYGHVAMFWVSVGRTPLTASSHEPAWWFHSITGTIFFVDWYFCMTGFILVYAAFTSGAVHRNTAAQWLYSVFHRYWRLAPIYLVTFWFCRSVLHLLGSGPLWDYNTSATGVRAICAREPWWRPLTLTSNWQPLQEECVMPAWYICNDMQFYLASPLLLVLLARRPRLAWALAGALSVASVASRTYRYLTDVQVQPLDLLRPRLDMVMRNNWDMYELYLLPHYRASSYLIGLLAGHYAFQVRSGLWSSPLYSGSGGGWPRRLVGLAGLLLVLSLHTASYQLDLVLPGSGRLRPGLARLLAALIYGLGHTLAGLAAALLFVALLLGEWPGLRRLLELPGWRYLSRINFFVYLFQCEAIVYMHAVGARPVELDTGQTWQHYAALVSLLYMASLVVHLLLEQPLSRLEAELVAAGGPGRPRRPRPAAPAGPQLGPPPTGCGEQTSPAANSTDHEPATPQQVR